MAARQIITTGILDYAELYWESLAFIGLGWDPKAVAHAVKRLNHITAIVNRSEFPA